MKLRVHGKSQHGLHPMEIHTLFLIKKLTKHTPEGVFVTDISKALHVAVPTITQKIASLEKKGFINRVHSNNDRRNVLISISDSAAALTNTMEDNFLKRCVGLANYLGAEESKQLEKLLDKTYNYFLNEKEKENETL